MLSNKKKEIVLMIIGGLGNQLFQYCKLNEYKRAGYKVLVDTSNNEKFKNHHLITYRRLAFEPEIFDFDSISKGKLFYINLIEFINRNKYFPTLSLIYKEINDQNFLQLDLKKYNKMIGYWQDINLLLQEKIFLINSLSKLEIFLDAFNKPVINGSTIVHVRRGDYLKLGENLNDNFYYKSLKYCEENIKNFQFEVFTDDYSWVVKNKIFNNATKIHKNLNDYKSDISSFADMMNFQNYVVGNSTYSLIPAILSETKESKIIVADPWFKNKKKNLNYPKNWIKITNS